MLKKHFSLILFAVYTFICLACLSWSADTVIRALKISARHLITPGTDTILSRMDQTTSFGKNMAQLIQLDKKYRDMEQRWLKNQISARKHRELLQENQRLTAHLNIKPLPSYTTLTARIWARDANGWFHSVLINRGQKHDITVSNPVICIQNNKEVLLGQISEVNKNTSRALFITDTLSAVSAKVRRTGAQGVVEGQGTNQLIMNYLFLDADIKKGDKIDTAGLGGVFPPGIMLGTVERTEHISRESFKRALVTPAVRLDKLQEVIVLKKQTAQKRKQGTK